jgi:hypothetical protein
MGSSGRMVYVISDVMRKAEEAFCGEVSPGYEKDINVMGKI